MTEGMHKIAEVPDLAVTRQRVRVLENRRLSETAYALSLERRELSFDAGRLLTLHGRKVTEDRSYTIASGEDDETLTILYRWRSTGKLTPQLVKLQPGDAIEISGPYGQFVLRDRNRPAVFIATGTGIAPARAYVRTYPDLDLTVVHGVRTASDLFFADEFQRHSYFPCLSAESGIGFSGRVTDFMSGYNCPPDAHYYLCGAYEMIYHMEELLLARGIDPAHIFVEGYYYRLE
jgi:NAD(P)H-flavin reductase